MKYRARIFEEEREVDLNQVAAGEGGLPRFEVALNGGPVTPAEARLEGDTLLLRLDGRAWRVLVDPAGAASAVEHVYLNGERLEVEVARGGAHAQGPRRRLHAGNARVTSPMPGRVVAVHVKPGDRLARGDLLLTLEAMKMQNEFASPVAGRVAAVRVAAGQVAAAGEVLVEIEPDAHAP